MGESNILEGEVVEATSAAAWVKTAVGTLTVQAHAAIGGAVTLSIRPEQLLIGGAGDGLLPLGRGTVREASFQGTHLRARVAMGDDGGHELLLRAPAARVAVPDVPIPYARSLEYAVLPTRDRIRQAVLRTAGR